MNMGAMGLHRCCRPTAVAPWRSWRCASWRWSVSRIVGGSARESVMRAAVSWLFVLDRRAAAFGIFNGVFGVAWFLGSLATGWAHEHLLLSVVVLSMTVQLLGAPLLFGRTPSRPPLSKELRL